MSHSHPDPTCLGSMWTGCPSRETSFATEMWEGPGDLVAAHDPEPSREVHWSEPLLAWIDEAASHEMERFDPFVQRLVTEALGARQAADDATRQMGRVR